MDAELLSSLKGLKEKTGIVVEIMPTTVLPNGKQAERQNVYSDKKNKTTYFAFFYKGQLYLASLQGASETERNYAFFLISLVEGQRSSISKSDFIKEVLLNECPPASYLKNEKRYSVPKLECYVLCINSDADKTDEVFTFLSSYISNGLDTAVEMGVDTCALIKFLAGNDDREQSGKEFAQILATAIEEETGVSVKIGVGGRVKDFSLAGVSYYQGTAAIQLGKDFNPLSKVNSYKQFISIKILEEVPIFRLSEYLDTLLTKEGLQIFSDPDMLKTAEGFLANDLNVSETSRILFMHRNTLMYRLEKIERLTGLNIKSFSDALTFKLMLTLFKLTERNK